MDLQKAGLWVILWLVVCLSSVIITSVWSVLILRIKSGVEHCWWYLSGYSSSSTGIPDYAQYETRQHSRRMHTARLETVHVSISVATTRCHSWRWVSPPEVTADGGYHHQMSLAEGEGWVSPPDASTRREMVGYPREEAGTLPIPWCMWYSYPLPQTEWQTAMKTLPSRNFFSGHILSFNQLD